jgi:hypothetical protein
MTPRGTERTHAADIWGGALCGTRSQSIATAPSCFKCQRLLADAHRNTETKPCRRCGHQRVKHVTMCASCTCKGFE